MENQDLCQEIIEKYNFPSLLAESIAHLYMLDTQGTAFADQAADSSDKAAELLLQEYDNYRKQEGLFFYQNFLPTLISVLKDLSQDKRNELYKNIKKCDKNRRFILGESRDAYFDIFETIIKNFDISPKTKNIDIDTQSVITDLKLRINQNIEQ